LVRGSDKPYALEWSKWTEWKNEQKKQRPFRYWLSDTCLRKLQNVVYFPLDIYYTIKTYIRNRYIDKIQYLHTGLKPGQYYDFDARILYGLFNELVYFVEVELAHLSKFESSKKYKFVKGRCQEAQDDYFRWANHLKDQGQLTEQAKGSRKIKELYEWWKYIRPQRVDRYDLEGKYYDEDTEMLIELIKVRNHLWT
jgi:hypothetical protein